MQTSELNLPVGLLINFGIATFEEGIRRVVNKHQDFASSRESESRGHAKTQRREGWLAMSGGDDKSFTQGNIQKPGDPELVADIRRMIEETRAAVAVTVNAGLTMLYWRIGKRVGEEMLKGERAEYGTEIGSTLSRQLVLEYGNGGAAR
jgi:Protein of unknown function (DUF1016).